MTTVIACVAATWIALLIAATWYAVTRPPWHEGEDFFDVADDDEADLTAEQLNSLLDPYRSDP